MKRSVLFFAMLACGYFMQAQTIPNGGFEQWNNGDATSWSSSFSYESTLATFTYDAGERSTDSHSGNYAMKVVPAEVDLTITTYTLPGMCHLGYFNTDAGLTSLLGIFNGGVNGIINSMVKGGVECNRVPSKVTAWIKYVPTGSDEMSVTVRCLHGDDIVAEGTYSQSNATNGYVQIEIPVTQNSATEPELINIIFSCGKTSGTELYIDDVALVFDNTGIDESTSNAFIISPNPANDRISIQTRDEQPYEARLFDTNGKMVWKGTSLSGTSYIDVTNLANGIYFVKIIANGETRTEKVIVR